ncbi:hypothetical protein [Tenacibaculum sp. Bg11-29]|uniref:hypothetical protein n=1 Tax=Tenacibaculum sp. Bg11-29 TaxID=2058306 RepID=UPI0012FF2236|nr:hypothetical protein [Tenacibaculum sp. Bg11-29]
MLLEIVLAVYIRVARVKIELPTYTFQNTQNFWFDLNVNYGTAHLPNHSYRQKKTCFDVLYKSNSSGFRDVERKLKEKETRVVALGDSFTEGIGVKEESRLTNLLENETNIPHINFGMAGNFGTTQYYLLYKTLAIKYTHDAVLVGILPSNDFIDNDYEINVKTKSNRYQPFLRGEYPNYTIKYHLDSIQKSKARPYKRKFIIKILKNFTNSYNMLAYLRTRRRIATIPKDKLLSPSIIPSYFNYSQKQLNGMRYAIEKIKKNAGNRFVMVYSIPVFKEIKAYRKHGKNPLGFDLKKICNTIGVEYLDLLPQTKSLTIEECEELFLSCDGHWSEKGNVFAKSKIKSHFTYYKK